MKSEVITITPGIAKEWLLLNCNNRPINSGTVTQYAKDMLSGNWQLNGETIKFSSEGKLLDGQHRLAAIVRAEVSIPMLVVRELSSDSFSTIDVGLRRSTAQILHMAGFKNTSALAAAARWVVILDKGIKEGYKIAQSEIAQAIEQHPLLNHYSDFHMGKKSKRILPSCCLAVFVLAGEKYERQKVDEFYSSVLSGEGLLQGDPAYVLREKFVTSTRSSRIDQEVAVGYTIKCVRAHVEGKRMQVLRFGKDEPMPLI
jgi:hypothetical protein